MFAVQNDFPTCDGEHPTLFLPCRETILTVPQDEWVTIKPYHLVLQLVSRISARVFVGLPLCRSPKWLETSTQFTENGKQSLYTATSRPNMLQSLFLWSSSGYSPLGFMVS